ncbi:hypothetical protein [Streptococcus vestibularis]|uniref:Uncharacterized protein n=1 Tax=Streptococcus vestibularis TaxID=1343 RepID=A0A564TMU4_STRVE|nr:hypothetical protein [Streptococcus vestibularis]VUX08531.1 Uncharacterised protein [Streptococcus vestibularis]
MDTQERFFHFLMRLCANRMANIIKNKEDDDSNYSFSTSNGASSQIYNFIKFEYDIKSNSFPIEKNKPLQYGIRPAHLYKFCEEFNIKSQNLVWGSIEEIKENGFIFFFMILLDYGILEKNRSNRVIEILKDKLNIFGTYSLLNTFRDDEKIINEIVSVGNLEFFSNIDSLIITEIKICLEYIYNEVEEKFIKELYNYLYEIEEGKFFSRFPKYFYKDFQSTIVDILNTFNSETKFHLNINQLLESNKELFCNDLQTTRYEREKLIQFLIEYDSMLFPT